MLKYSIKTLSICLLVVFVSCNSTIGDQAKSEKSELKTGMWRMVMQLNKQELPFHFTINKEANNEYTVVVINDTEEIEVKGVKLINDSLVFDMPIFESTFYLQLINQENLSGNWVNYYKSNDYKIPVTAKFGETFRFADGKSNRNVEGKYEAVFNPNGESPYPAIGIFKQTENKVTGTFATETGDYRHLEGNIIGDSLYLSTFDGSHAFLFKGTISDSSINGTFWSGNHYKVDWLAKRNDNATLRDANSLTYLNEGYDSFTFTLPDHNGDTISIDDEKFSNKALIVQIMGSWCPNCLDETKYLTQLYNTYHNQGLEIVAVAFERTKSEEQAYINLNKLKERTGAKYSFLLGGADRKTKASEIFPMLNHIMSYPTTIFIDKNKEIQRIHTGFYGPSTGKYYDDFVKETEELVEQMLKG